MVNTTPSGGSGGDSIMTASPGDSPISITLEEHLKVGSIIKATTTHGHVYEGEVMAVDSKTRLAFLSVPVSSTGSSGVGSGSTVVAHSSSSSTTLTPAISAADSTSSSTLMNGGALSKCPSRSNVNIVMLNLNMLQDLVAIRGPSEASQVATLGPVSIPDMEHFMRNSVTKKMKRVQAVGVDVPPVAQALFDKLKCQYNNCAWSGPKILIEDVKVTISDIKEPLNGGRNEFPCVTGDKESSVQHVRNLIEQFWPQCIQQLDTGGVGNKKS